jgi:hypothetical protein
LMAKRADAPPSKAELPVLPTCETCKFWMPAGEGAEHGICRRFPPPPLGEKVVTTDKYWCGEHRPRTA